MTRTGIGRVKTLADDLEALRTCLEGSVRLATQIVEDAPERERAGTPARPELDDEDDLRGDWDDHPVSIATGIAEGYLRAADDHLRALQLVLDPERAFVYTPYAIARAAIECCARAWWLLEPNIGSRRRVARGMSELLFSLNEQRDVPNAGTDEFYRERLETIRSTAIDKGFIVKGKKDRFWLDDERRPWATPLLREFLKRDLFPSMGESVFRYWSGMTHGLPYAVFQHVKFVNDAALEIRLPPDAVAVLAAVTLQAYVQARGRHFEMFAWKTPEWESWVEHAIGTIGQVVAHDLGPD